MPVKRKTNAETIRELIKWARDNGLALSHVKAGDIELSLYPLQATSISAPAIEVETVLDQYGGEIYRRYKTGTDTD